MHVYAYAHAYKKSTYIYNFFKYINMFNVLQRKHIDMVAKIREHNERIQIIETQTGREK